MIRNLIVIKKSILAFEYLKQEKENNIYNFDIQFLKENIHHDSAHSFVFISSDIMDIWKPTI